MTVVDLDATRAERAAKLAEASAATKIVVGAIAESAREFADLAFSVTGPLWHRNERFALDINRGQRRRLLAGVRRVCREAEPEVRRELVDFARDVYGARLNELSTERDRTRTKP